MKGSNIGPARTRKDRPLRYFDRLPAAVRKALAEAPYDYEFSRLGQHLRLVERTRGRPLTDDELHQVVASMRQYHADELAVSAYVLYGDGHPQARVMTHHELRRRKLLSIYDEHAAWREGRRA